MRSIRLLLDLRVTRSRLMGKVNIRATLGVQTLAVVCLSIHLHRCICCEHLVAFIQVGDLELILLVHIDVVGSGVCHGVANRLRVSILHKWLIHVLAVMIDIVLFEETRVIYDEVLCSPESVGCPTNTNVQSLKFLVSF